LLTDFEGLKLTAGTVLLSPYIPFLFMGEEYGEEAPFFYFIDHSDQELIEAVRKSKAEEFQRSGVKGEAYDPQSPETLKRSRLNWELQLEGKHKILWEFYQHLIQLRKTHPALKKLDKKSLTVLSQEAEKLLFLHRWSDDGQVFYLMNFSDRPVSFLTKLPSGNWQKFLDSTEEKWLGPGASMPDKLFSDESITLSAHSFTLYQS
jgi:maltooligosyltrehalose trehalohydrolase